MLDAMREDAESRNDWALFPHTSKGYFYKIRELGGEIREYIQDLPDVAEIPTAKLGSA